MKIVIVEDEIRIREGLARLIHKLNPDYHIVGIAEDGLTGLRMIKEKVPDLVITDVRMPDIDGLEMLCRLKENNVRTRAIVLTAYSEFAYAREAIKLGVSEYLLKPVNVGDLSRSLKNVEAAIAAELISRTGSKIRTLDNILYTALSGDGSIDDRDEAVLADSCHLDSAGHFAFVSVYLGRNYITAGPKAKGLVKAVLSALTGLDHRIIELPKVGKLVIFLYGFEDEIFLKRWFAHVFAPELGRGGLKNYCCAWISFDGLSGLDTAMHQLNSCLEWNLVFDDGKLIVCPDVQEKPSVPLCYPITIEHQVRCALASHNRDRFESGIGDFLRHLHDGKIHTPKEIKETLIRFIWVVLNTAREVAYDKYERLAQQEILEKISFAVTWSELESALAILMQLATEEPAGEAEDRFIINRTKNLVLEFYSQGITLEEIASRINVTPEYLSARFHYETGIMFSAYIKGYRMQKAKELLIGTDLKLYTVAEKVGYRDAKYFCRVFKETIGQSPSDYRKTKR